VPFYLNTS